MSKELHVPAEPCASCPYRKDVPHGIWHPTEYAKLRTYDDGFQEIPALGVFLCHASNFKDRDSVCRGWLSVHCDSVAVRLGVITGQIPPEAPFAKVKAKLFKTGKAAADAGMRAINRPGKAARKMIDKLGSAIERGKRKNRT